MSDVTPIQREKKGNSFHGGNYFAGALTTGAHKKVTSSTSSSQVADKTLDRSFGSKTPWSVHDGKFFAKAVFEEQPRAPQEKRFVERERKAGNMAGRLGPQARVHLRELGIPASVIERVAARQLQLMEEGNSPLVLPARLKDLGGNIIPIDELRIQERFGLGAFSSVHRATLRSDPKDDIALKIFFHPVSREGALPGGTEMSGVIGTQGYPSSFPDSPKTTPNNSRHRGDLWHMASKKAPDPRVRKMGEFEAYDAYSFAQEVAILSSAGLRHPNITQYVGHGFVATPDGIAGFIATRLIVGDDLYAILAQHKSGGGITLSTGVRWLHDIASAVAFLHSHGIVHRDIKESNVMVVKETSTAVLIDLGLAMQGSPGGEYRFQVHRRFGVRGYRAPEVNRQEPYGIAVDIFAFGRIAYNVLGAFARPPKAAGAKLMRAWFWDAWLEAGLCGSNQLRSWAYETLFCNPLLSTAWPEELRVVIRRCLSSRPAERPTAVQILGELSQLQARVDAAA